MHDLLPLVSLAIFTGTTGAAVAMQDHALRSSRDEIAHLMTIARRIFRAGIFAATLTFGWWLVNL